MSSEPTVHEQKPHLFKPGQSGNPAGRPKGSKNVIVEDFLKDVQAAWTEKGKEAIDAMIADRPGDFVKMVASLVPKDVNLNINDHSEMTDDELAERVRNLAAQLAPLLADGAGNLAEGAAGEASAQVPPRVH